MTTQCTQCNSTLNPQSKFCPNCGATVPEEAAAPAQAQSYTPPPAQGSYTPPPQSYTPPQQGGYTPPQAQGGYTPPQQAPGGYTPPAYNAPQAQKQKKPMNPKLFLFGGIGVAAVLVIVLLVSLLGGKDKSATADAAYLGVWEAVSLVDEDGDTYTVEELFDDGFTLDLMKKGKCISDFDGDRETLKWSVKDNVITIKEGSDLFFKGTIKDGRIVAEDFPDTDNTMTFVKRGYTAPAISGPGGNAPIGGKADGGDTPKTDVQAKWNGSWYGDMWVTEASGYYAEYDGNKFDAYMVLDVKENGEGTLAIFLGREEGKTVDAYIRADINHFEVTEGEFWDMPLDPGVWWLALSPVDEGNFTVISDTYIDPERTPNDRFEFMFRFRPWGELWEQEEREGSRLPPGYADYKKAIESGVADPNAWDGGNSGGVAVTPTPVKPSTPTATATPAPQTAEPQRLPAAKIREAYDAMDPSGMTYEEVRDMYLAGVDGEPESRDNPDIRAYVWRAVEADHQTMYISFKKNAADKYVYTSRSISNIPKPE